MTPSIIANLIFWGCVVSFVVFIYQGIVLPGIRLHLRYRVFLLRDRLRRLVIEQKLEEDNSAFVLLHSRLNFMCTSLARVDLARAIQALSSLDAESRARHAHYMKVLEAAPEEVRKIFKESLDVFALALAANSLFVFLAASACLLAGLAVKSSLGRVKELFLARVEDDTSVAFFSPELATV